MEYKLLIITGIAEPEWRSLRCQLEACGLLVPEALPRVTSPFLRFHPTLAPLLWAQLGADERLALSVTHRQQYDALARYLYNADRHDPHKMRAVAQRDLPNVLHALHATLDTGDPEVLDFATSVNAFLRFFGLKQEAEAIIARSKAAAKDVDSRAWLLTQADRGEQCFDGQVNACVGT